MQIKNLDDIDIKQVLKIVDIKIPAKNAKIGPPIGPALSPTKIKVNDFCVAFNNATINYKEYFPLNVKVIVYKNKSFNFLIKTPTIYFLLKNIMKLKKKDYIELFEIYQIAKIKYVNFEHINDLKIIYKNVCNLIKKLNIKILK